MIRSSFVNEFNHKPTQPMSEERPPPKRRRQMFIILLGLQILLLLLVFPGLFVYFENEQSQPELEQMDETTSLSEPQQSRSYIDGLYWSLFTPLTIGSDEAWPQTRSSRVLIRVSDVVKLTTVGVIAGLFHDTIVTRKIQRNPGLSSTRSRRLEDELLVEQGDSREQVFIITKGQRTILYTGSAEEIARKLVELLFKPDEGEQDTPNDQRL